MYILDGQQITGQFTYNEIQYGSDWLPNSTQEERDALGIVWEDDLVPVTVVSVPKQITRRQGRRILEQYGLLSTVESIIAQGTVAQKIDYADASTFDRDNETFIAIVHACGLTDAQLDEMFIAGGQL